MDQNRKEKREINPRQDANIFSIVTFFFTYKIFKKGLKNDLQEYDVYDILHGYNAKQLGDKLEEEWEAERKKNLTPSLIRLLLRYYGKTYFLYGIMQLIMKTLFYLISPMAMGKLVSYFSPGQTKLGIGDAYFYAALTIGTNALYFFYSHNYMLIISQFCLKLRAAFCSLLYRKALKMTPKALSEVTTGKIVTLISKDVNNFDVALIFLNDLWIGIIQTSIIAYIMYLQIGVSALIGLFVFIMIIPLHLFIAKIISKFRMKSAAKTDGRLRVTQEVLTQIKIIKMFNWEKYFKKVVDLYRRYEINILKKIYCLKAVGISLGTLSSKVSFYVCVMCYIYFGEFITAEKAFIVLSCYNMLRSTFTIFIPLGIAQLAEFKIALERITQVLVAEEITPDKNFDEIKFSEEKPRIALHKISVEASGNKILDGITLEINTGLTTIAGYVGSGKSALLGLILNDLSPSEGSVQVLGRISYASQEPWLFPGTIKQNILFGQPYDKHRYEKVLHMCCLNLDLQYLPLGDETVAGDKGLNLSRGQQARINLARAVYKDCEIYLLDDCFSALDAHVTKQIFDVCVLDFLKNKICVLVTHQLQHMQESDKIIVLSQGTVQSSGSYNELQEKGTSLNVIDVEEPKVSGGIEKIANDVDEANEESKLIVPANTKNVYAEKKEEGKIKFTIYKKYFNFGGGICILISIIFLFLIAQMSMSYSDILVSKWIDVEERINLYTRNSTDQNIIQNVVDERSLTLKKYTAMILVASFFTIGRALAFFMFTSRASVRLHKTNFKSILDAPMTFFDNHMMANILNRFSRDLGTVDEFIPYIIFEVFRILLILLGITYVVCSVNLIFILPTAVLVVILFSVRHFYLPTSRSLKRLEGVTRSPVIGHLSASLEGISTIRASRAENILKDEFDKHQDIFNSVFYMTMTTSRAFGFLMDIVCVIYIAILTTTFLTVDTGALAGRVGLALTQAFALTGLLQWGFRQWADLENQMTCVERVLEYTGIVPEDKTGDSPEDWPRRGKIEYKNVNLTYYGCTEPVFRNLSFLIEPKAKIGIVGRTGAGKSSMIATLFKLYDIEGSITIDDVDIRKINTETLRSNISIIPQNPVLFSGTIRDNLDPNQECSDTELWKALEEVNLKELIPNLQQNINEGGGNYSAGQRQLICLARAVIRKNKILVLDEATANVDPQTDALIQATIKTKFAQCTVLTIAHRLDSVINSDKVMVIHTGQLIEYDSPKVLLENKRSAFYKMARQAGIVQ